MPSNPIMKVPDNCKPPKGRIAFLQNHGKRSHRVDVLSTGEVRWISGDRKVQWLSLDGMLWS